MNEDKHIQVFAEKLIHKIWIKKEVELSELVEVLGLHKDGFVSNPAFIYWRKYYMKHFDDDLVDKLVYGLHDLGENPADLINGLVVAATTDKDAHTQVLAKKLINRIWIEETDPINIVKRLGLEKGDLFSNPAFRYWREYYKERCKATDDDLVNALVPALHELVKSPADLINGLVVAATTDKDKHIQVFAEKLIHKIWSEQPAKPEDLVKSLELYKNEFLSNPALPIWIRYCETLPDYETKGEIAHTLGTFGEYTMMSNLIQGKEDPSTSEMATFLFDDIVAYYSALDPEDRMKKLFGDPYGKYDGVQIPSPQYTVWKAVALTSTLPPEEEESIFLNALREAFNDNSIKYPQDKLA